MVSLNPAKGTRDLLPAAARRRQYIVDTIRAVYEQHGFEPLSTPAFERLDTLMGKYGDEGDQLIFRILKRGAALDRALAAEPTQDTLTDLALRYDLTVPLARVVAAYGNDIPRFFRRYQIEPVWRADRPQKGRFREFTQCDADIVGCKSQVADAEVLSCMATGLSRLGFDDEVVIRVNHRDVLFGMIEAAGIPADLEVTALVAVDKLDKVGWDGVTKELMERGVGQDSAARLKEILEGDTGLPGISAALEGSERGRRGAAELTELFGLVAQAGVRFTKFDPSLARGLSYYTGPIFEAIHPKLAGSIAGGGRYDNLVGMFLGRDVPAVGFTLGLDRLEVVMDELGLFPTARSGPDAIIAFMGDAGVSLGLASLLREAGLRVDVYPEPGKFKRQFQYAQEIGARFFLVVGDDELAAGEVTVKELATREQERLPRAAVAERLRR